MTDPLYYPVPPELHGDIGRGSELVGIDEVKTLEPGMDFRKPTYRREVWHRFYTFHLRYGSHPGMVYALMRWLGEECDWTMEDRLWFAYINGCTQHPPTSLLIFNRYPDPFELDEEDLDRWFNANFTRLGWDTDRRHQKASFPACVRDYRTHLADMTQREFFDFLAGAGADPFTYFREVWEYVRNNFLSFGRLSTFSYLEYLRIMGLPLNCSELFLDDMSGSKSHRNGLAKVLGRDDLDWYEPTGFDGRYAKGQLEWLAKEGKLLLYEAQIRNQFEPWADDVNYFTLESALCTWKSWHRPNRRYPNCYADMLFNRLRKFEVDWPDELGIAALFWEARRKLLPDYLLLEQQPFDLGLRPEKQNWYRNTGEVIMMWRDDPVFENGYNARYNS